MNIIYVSNCCSDKKFEEIRVSGETKTIPQAQKFNQLLIKGLSSKINGNVFAVSAIPTNRKWSKKHKYVQEKETIDNLTYIYESFINYPILRQICLFTNAKKTILKLCKGNVPTIIICDVLNYSLAKAVIKVAKKAGIKTIGIVTDIPGMLNCNRKNAKGIRKIVGKYLTRKKLELIEKFDSYLLLSEAMNEIINRKKKPCVVIEGASDINMLNIDNKIEDKVKPRVIMYAGSLHKEYGIKLLVEAFILGEYESCELHIYGDGNYVNELNVFAEKNKSIKYFGVVSNEEVVKRQLCATLLINPRPTSEDFVKYSFPSKTMEYMASGTPLLMTKIPSLPTEYCEHVYLIEEETVEGVINALNEVLSKSQEELHHKGAKAKEFILKEKNNLVQANKIIKFIENNYS